MRSSRWSAALLAVSANIGLVSGHTFIYGVFVNGVDEGSFKGVRTPGFNGPPPRGYANSPVKDLNSLDMRCNILGDKQVPHTINVMPGDNVTLDWHHDARIPADEIIADSHHGPILIYLSPDPPAENSFVKILEKGKYEEGAEPLAPGKWATTSDVAKNHGHMNVRIPAGLKPGPYLMRAEMIGLHEADAIYTVNPRRGAQFYPNCVQLMVGGNGTVELPQGVSFPGAYKYEDPGIFYDVYCSTKTKTTAPCTTTYQIPGPTVWSGAWPNTTAVEVGPISGDTKITRWSSWIQNSVVTSGTYDGTAVVVAATSTYTASWPTAYQAPAAMA